MARIVNITDERKGAFPRIFRHVHDDRSFCETDIGCRDRLRRANQLLV